MGLLIFEAVQHNKHKLQLECYCVFCYSRNLFLAFKYFNLFKIKQIINSGGFVVDW